MCFRGLHGLRRNFNSHAPCGARPSLRVPPFRKSEFQLTRPLRGATSIFGTNIYNHAISTHTPLAGRDDDEAPEVPEAEDFNSHAPCGARLHYEFERICHEQISTHTPLAGRDYLDGSREKFITISTHTPLAGRDVLTDEDIEQRLNISTHTPLAGRDRLREVYGANVNDFNSHAPCGARRLRKNSFALTSKFQLTRPLRGATPWKPLARPSSKPFQLTRPLRGATSVLQKCGKMILNFNSHAPCGARRSHNRQ